VEYGYDAEDKRVSKKLTTSAPLSASVVTTEKYIYDGSDIALVLNAAGTLVERYLYGAGVDNVLSREKSGTVVWSLGDRQGSVVDLVSENGTILNHFVYDGFGNRTGMTSADFRYGYTGRELDTETGLYYYRARYYDPSVGRFISEDPIGFAAGDTNLYRYVNNNPTNYTDPSGELAFLAPAALAWGAYVVIGAGLAAAATSAAWGFARGVAESIDSDRRNGILGWDSIGSAYINGLIGAGKGAVGGFVTGVTTAALTLGAIYLAVPGAVITGVGLTIGTIGVGTGLINAGVNFAQGNYATGFVDLAGAIYGGSKVWSDYQDSQLHSQLRWYEEPSLPPSSGAGSGLATKPDWSQGGNGSPMILPGGTGENGSTKMPSNVTVDPIVQETQLTHKGGGYFPDSTLNQINEVETFDIEKQFKDLACGMSVGQSLLRDVGIDVSQEELSVAARNHFVNGEELIDGLNQLDRTSGLKWYQAQLPPAQVRHIEKLNSTGRAWAAKFMYDGNGVIIYHWVRVDGINNQGNLMIKDPWGKHGSYNPTTPATKYDMSIEDFIRNWSGEAVYGYQ
jgi:RHS repeat-associated protein